jgi:hypothetical protein
MGANTTRTAIAVGATTGAVDGVATDLITQGTHISAGIQDEYDAYQTIKSGALGTVIGGVASGDGKVLYDKYNQQPKVNTEAIDAPDTAPSGSVGAMKVEGAVLEMDPAPNLAAYERMHGLDVPRVFTFYSGLMSQS